MCNKIGTRLIQVGVRWIGERQQGSCRGATICSSLLALHGVDRSELNPLLALSQLLAFTLFTSTRTCLSLCCTIRQPACSWQSAWRLFDALIGFKQLTFADNRCFLIDLLAAPLA